MEGAGGQATLTPVPWGRGPGVGVEVRAVWVTASSCRTSWMVVSRDKAVEMQPRP